MRAVTRDDIITSVDGIELHDDLDCGIVMGFDLEQDLVHITDCKEGWSISIDEALKLKEQDEG